jgi:hypothetical protein
MGPCIIRTSLSYKSILPRIFSAVNEKEQHAKCLKENKKVHPKPLAISLWNHAIMVLFLHSCISHICFPLQDLSKNAKAKTGC